MVKPMSLSVNVSRRVVNRWDRVKEAERWSLVRPNCKSVDSEPVRQLIYAQVHALYEETQSAGRFFRGDPRQLWQDPGDLFPMHVLGRKL